MTRIMLIDDEALVRRAFRLVLSKAGYEIVDFAGGRAAANRIAELSPDLVIVDMVMPEQDGIETIEQIRQVAPDQRFIAVTGGGPMGPDHLIDRVKGMGVAVALKKPVDRDQLVSAVMSTVGPP